MSLSGVGAGSRLLKLHATALLEGPSAWTRLEVGYARSWCEVNSCRPMLKFGGCLSRGLVLDLRCSKCSKPLSSRWLSRREEPQKAVSRTVLRRPSPVEARAFWKVFSDAYLPPPLSPLCAQVLCEALSIALLNGLPAWDQIVFL